MEKKIKIELGLLAIVVVFIGGWFVLNDHSIQQQNEKYCEKDMDCILGSKKFGIDENIKAGCFNIHTKGVNVLSDDAIADPSFPFGSCKCENNICVSVEKEEKIKKPECCIECMLAFKHSSISVGPGGVDCRHFIEGGISKEFFLSERCVGFFQNNQIKVAECYPKRISVSLYAIILDAYKSGERDKDIIVAITFSEKPSEVQFKKIQKISNRKLVKVSENLYSTSMSVKNILSVEDYDFVEKIEFFGGEAILE